MSGPGYGGVARGCELCCEGAKSVLFLTGSCPLDCFYCPVSEERRKDSTWINERPVESRRDVLDEVRMSGSSGTAITGGDPGTDVDEAASIIEALKLKFGAGHHVHMYTALPLTEDDLRVLREAGLDELRLHPPEYEVPSGMLETAETAAGSFSLGAEIPALPGLEDEAVESVEELVGIEFVNVNELEFSDSNCEGLVERGFEARGDGVSARGSLASAAEIAERLDVPARVCTARFKDSVQLRERYKRRAENVATCHRVTEDGTMLVGRIEGDVDGALELFDEEGVDERLFEERGDHVKCDPELLRGLARRLKSSGLECAVDETLPVHGKTLIGREPL